MYYHSIREKKELEEELMKCKLDLDGKNKEIEKCFNIINDQNSTIKKLTEVFRLKLYILNS